MDEIKIQNFAPVVIPTLCRYDHFKRSLESLMKCTHADKTKVYIGLDYPSKKEHWDGYNKIVKYLDSIANTHPFKDLIVVKRDHNLGAGLNGNASQLNKYVISHHETMIFSEDDNEFAPSFLEYCNKGLEKYKDDKSILAILGYTPMAEIKYNQNTFFYQNIEFSAWGYGIWRDRYEEIKKIDRKWLKGTLSLGKLYKIAKRYGYIKVYEFISYSLPSIHPFRVADRVLSCYMIATGKKVIMPVVSLVRNWGTDGSGVNFHNITREDTLKFANQNINECYKFEFSGTGEEYREENTIAVRNANRLNISFGKFLKMMSRRIITAVYARTIYKWMHKSTY